MAFRKLKEDNIAVKRNHSSMQVFKTLQVLMENDYSMTELIEKLNLNEKEPVFNNSVISKYINTCRACGFEIPKIHNKYFVASMPFGLNLTTRDVELMEMLQLEAVEILTKRQVGFFNDLVTKISKYSNRNLIRVEKATFDITKESFERAIIDKKMIRLMFRVKNIIECIPLCMKEHKGKPYFCVKYNGKEKLFAVDRISGLEVLAKSIPETNDKFSDKTVVYKLKGPLSERYTLKDNESLLSDFRPDYIVISNAGEDLDILYSRLLRYDSLCEILNPLSAREDMKNILNETLSNYGE